MKTKTVTKTATSGTTTTPTTTAPGSKPVLTTVELLRTVRNLVSDFKLNPHTANLHVNDEINIFMRRNALDLEINSMHPAVITDRNDTTLRVSVPSISDKPRYMSIMDKYLYARPSDIGNASKRLAKISVRRA